MATSGQVNTRQFFTALARLEILLRLCIQRTPRRGTRLIDTLQGPRRCIEKAVNLDFIPVFISMMNMHTHKKSRPCSGSPGRPKARVTSRWWILLALACARTGIKNLAGHWLRRLQLRDKCGRLAGFRPAPTACLLRSPCCLVAASQICPLRGGAARAATLSVALKVSP